jgi:hypothetical protein
VEGPALAVVADEVAAAVADEVAAAVDVAERSTHRYHQANR